MRTLRAVRWESIEGRTMCCVFISLSIITTLNSTHARQQSLLLLTGRHRRVLSSSHVVYSTHSNHTLCTQHTTHTRTRLIQFKPPLLPATAPPSRLCSLPALTSLFSLDRRGGRLRLSQPSRIPSRTNNSTHTPHGSGKKTPSKQHSTCCKHPAAAAAAATAAHLTAHTKPRLSSTGTYLIELPLCDLTPSR